MEDAAAPLVNVPVVFFFWRHVAMQQCCSVDLHCNFHSILGRTILRL